MYINIWCKYSYCDFLLENLNITDKKKKNYWVYQ